jgi:hypothetical protein
MARSAIPNPPVGRNRPFLISLAILLFLSILRLRRPTSPPLDTQTHAQGSKKAWKPPPPFQPQRSTASSMPAAPAPVSKPSFAKIASLPSLPTSLNWWNSNQKAEKPLCLNLYPDSGAEWPRSIPSSLCGKNWQQDYAEYHNAVLSLGDSSRPKPHKDVWKRNPFAIRGNKPQDQRFLIYVCPKREEDTCGGTADRLQGMVSGFIFSLLTNRVFLIDMQGPIKGKDIFTAPNFDWSYNIDTWRANNGLNNHTMPTSLEYWMHKSPDPLVKDISENKIDDKNIIIFRGNRGYAYLMWQRADMGSRMEEFGWTRRTAYACAMNCKSFG